MKKITINFCQISKKSLLVIYKLFSYNNNDYKYYTCETLNPIDFIFFREITNS